MPPAPQFPPLPPPARQATLAGMIEVDKMCVATKATEPRVETGKGTKGTRVNPQGGKKDMAA